jgi:hypothetical protein
MADPRSLDLCGISQSIALTGAATQPVGQHTPVNPSAQKFYALPKFGFGVCVAHPGSSLRGDLVVVLIASRACGGRGSVGMRGAGRAGSPCEPAATCGRAALLGFVSSVSFRLRRQGRENCGEMAGRAYGKTVWSCRPAISRAWGKTLKTHSNEGFSRWPRPRPVTDGNPPGPIRP